jgi:hypothetical protein
VENPYEWETLKYTRLIKNPVIVGSRRVRRKRQEEVVRSEMRQ